MSPIRFRLRDLRDESGLSQEALAVAARTRQATLSNLERGRTTRIEFALLDRLCRVLSQKMGRRVGPGDLFAIDSNTQRRGR